MPIVPVTPLVGVWMEIAFRVGLRSGVFVTPLVGVWIEIYNYLFISGFATVTPLVGVWIEITIGYFCIRCGFRHSPCGSVD